jgi:UDP-N-acetylmuramoyl-tripeptide--D-alanyl-D-alanine ligase
MESGWNTAQVLEATDGRLLSGHRGQRFATIGIDSRSVEQGMLFVAIRGEVHDGHRFALAALAGGAAGILVERTRAADLLDRVSERPEPVVIAVDDTTRALGRLASYHRRRCGIPLVALTGSNGKTTTRAMTEQVLGTRFSVMATIGNLNNPIGLPLTLLRLADRHEVAVVELGMNHPGEIDYLAGIADPDVGIITNVAPAHLEGLGSIDGVRDAKGELLGRIKSDGTALLNADDAKVRELVPRCPVRTLLFGESSAATIRAEGIVETTEGIGFRLVTPDGDADVRLRVHGRFMVANALAAAAAGHTLGLTAWQIRQGLERFAPVKGRLETVRVGGLHVIDDTYNANPASMAAALKTLETLRGDARSIAVLGDMLELGEASPALHRELGERAAAARVDRLLAAGAFAEAVADGARTGGMDPDRIRTGTVEEVARAAAEMAAPGDWILVKGSRGMRMERVVGALRSSAAGTPS